jgi:hypothetical protein
LEAAGIPKELQEAKNSKCSHEVQRINGDKETTPKGKYGYKINNSERGIGIVPPIKIMRIIKPSQKKFNGEDNSNEPFRPDEKRMGMECIFCFCTQFQQIDRGPKNHKEFQVGIRIS